MTNIVSIASLKLDPRNARKHSKKNLDAIKGSLRKFGQQKPIVVSEDDIVIAGNGTLQAAKELGWDKIEIKRSTLKGSDIKAYALADNRAGELAEWEDTLLEEALKQLQDEKFELAAIGFDDKDLAKFIAQEVKPGLTDDDEIPENVETRCKLGDLWVLGGHRLLCGDSTDILAVEKLMDGEKADILHTDPPYNVDYSNQDRPKPGKKNLGRIKNDCIPNDLFRDFIFQALNNGFVVTKDNSSAYIWYASKESVNFIENCQKAGWEINQQIIWKKPMLLGRGRYQWAHEPCLFAIKGKPWFTDDRTKTIIWDFGGYDKSKNVHPTQKPVFLAEEAISNSSKIGSNVLDLFLGSGSTLIACEKTNRKCFGMELDPHYCDVIITRWEKFTGKTAVLTAAGDQNG